MFVPMPRKIKEIRKNAASTMDTNLTQKLILLRFIIITGDPPRSLGTETIVYHVTAADRHRVSPAGRSLEDLPLGISILERSLDHGEVGPFPCIERPSLGLDTERPRASDSGKLEDRSEERRVGKEC